MSRSDPAAPLRVAYFNTQYPSLSHTFIEREVRAVREEGIQVQTFSKRPGDHARLGPAHDEAASTTVYLLDSVSKLCLAQAAGLRRPLAYLRAMWAGQKISSPGLGARLRHLAYFAQAVRLAAEMRRRSIGHVHVHMANNGATIALLACTFDPSLSYSISIHGSAEFFEIPLVRLDLKAGGATFVRCISNFCQAQVMAWTRPEDWSRFHIIHCGVDPDAFQPAAPSIDGPFRILTVGRLVAIKGYPILLEACAQLSKAGIDWHLDMVGDGPLRPILERCAGDAGIADRVTFAGAVGQDKIQDYFDPAHVMVTSSFMEGVPVVLMEAMAKRMAVAASRVGGIPELVEDGVSGLLVSPASAPELAAALRTLAGDRPRLAEMGKAGRQRIVAEFSSLTLGREMACLFRRYLTVEADAGKASVVAPAPA